LVRLNVVRRDFGHLNALNVQIVVHCRQGRAQPSHSSPQFEHLQKTPYSARKQFTLEQKSWEWQMKKQSDGCAMIFWSSRKP
jgi:hypothetical protein